MTLEVFFIFVIAGYLLSDRCMYQNGSDVLLNHVLLITYTRLNHAVRSC